MIQFRSRYEYRRPHSKRFPNETTTQGYADISQEAYFHWIEVVQVIEESKLSNQAIFGSGEADGRSRSMFRLNRNLRNFCKTNI